MARPNYGPQAKQRTKRLLEALLAYANHELEDAERLKIQSNWNSEKRLIVKTKIRFLQELTALAPPGGKLNSEQIKEALHRLEDFLGILEDNRVKTQGADDWHFTLKLWYGRQDQQANLKRLDVEWERRRLQKPIGEERDNTKADFRESTPPIQDLKSKIQNQIDWGEAPEVSSFYGRTEELHQLERWIVHERCKLIALLGIGGIGKTTLAVMLVEQIQEQFECVVWRSLKSAPPIQTLLESLLQSLSQGKETLSSDDVQQGISQLLHHLRQRRCLVILDEVEVILSSHEGHSCPQLGQYQEGYEGYGELLRRVGGERHQSCILLTSREKPGEITALEGETLPVHSHLLWGLQAKDAIDIFREKGFSGSENGLIQLIHLYGGNPLALKVIITMIQEICSGNISYFLQQNTLVLSDRLRTLLKQQVNRLSELEKEVVYWLAIEREPISLSRLRANLLLPPSQSRLLEALASLERRSLIEKVTPAPMEKMAEGGETLFTLQPLVMKYAIEEFIEQAVNEIEAVLETHDIEPFKLLRNHSLIKPNAPSNPDGRGARPIASTQMLTRLRNGLLQMFRCDDSLIAEELSEILPLLRGKSAITVGYTGRNLLKLFEALGIDSDTYDWQDIPMR